MSKPLEVEVWPCGYVAKCSVPWCRRHATTIMRYLDNRGRPYRQNAVWETHARELSVDMKVINRRSCAPFPKERRTRGKKTRLCAFGRELLPSYTKLFKDSRTSLS
jgi:hypothetical protein